MSSFSSVEADKVWCPVRALKWYLDRTKDNRSSTSLFVSSIEPFKAISKASISRWLVECITMAGPEALVSGRLRAHDTRSVSSSWALFNGASLKDIQQRLTGLSLTRSFRVISRMLWLLRLHLPPPSLSLLPLVLVALVLPLWFLCSFSFFLFSTAHYFFSFLLH